MNSWELFWKASASLGTFGSDEGVIGIPKELQEYWSNTFTQIKETNQFPMTMLDIGTGNGVIPYLCLKALSGSEVNITGIDLAYINPLSLGFPTEIKKVIEQVDFTGGINAANLPFESSTFDLVTSNYAVEYSDLSKSLSQIKRVLTEQGHFYGVFHSIGSVTYQSSLAGIAFFEELFGRYKIFDLLEELVRSRKEMQSKKRKELFVLLTNLKQEKGASQQDEWMGPCFQHIAEICMKCKSADYKSAKIHSLWFKENYSALLERLMQQVKASFSLEMLDMHFEAAGFKNVEMLPAIVKSKSVGICVVARP